MSSPQFIANRQARQVLPLCTLICIYKACGIICPASRWCLFIHHETATVLAVSPFNGFITSSLCRVLCVFVIWNEMWKNTGICQLMMAVNYPACVSLFAWDERGIWRTRRCLSARLCLFDSTIKLETRHVTSDVNNANRLISIRISTEHSP